MLSLTEPRLGEKETLDPFGDLQSAKGTGALQTPGELDPFGCPIEKEVCPRCGHIVERFPIVTYRNGDRWTFQVRQCKREGCDLDGLTCESSRTHIERG